MDPEEEIKHEINNLSFASTRYPEICSRLEDLAALNYGKYIKSGNITDLDATIEYELRICALTPDGCPDLVQRLARLAASYNLRYTRSGNQSDLRDAIDQETKAHALTTWDDPDFVTRVAGLGALYFKLFRHLGDITDLHTSINFQAQALSIIPQEHELTPSLLEKLALAYITRSERTGDSGDLDKAIEYGTRAHKLTPEGEGNIPNVLAILSSSLCNRFRYLGNLNDLTKAIEYQTQAYSITPQGHPNLPAQLSNLGTLYQDRYSHLGDIGDLNRAIELLNQVNILTHDGHPYLALGLENLGAAYSKRFERLGNSEDLEMAMKMQTQAYALGSEKDPDFPILLGSLATSHYNRFRYIGDLNDLQKAIGFQSQAYSLTPEGHPRLPPRLGRLASLYYSRSVRLNDPADLSRAIEFQGQAHILTPKEHPKFPIQLGSLGALYYNRFRRIGDPNDLDNAIKLQNQASIITPVGHPELPAQLGLLGTSYYQRFNTMGDVRDLNQAIEYETQACLLTPQGHPDAPRWMSNIGQSYHERYARLGDPQDLEEAINYEKKAITLIPIKHADRSELLLKLGVSYCSEYELLKKASSLEQSIDCFKQASASSIGHPRDRYDSALRLAKVCLKYDRPGCLDAYQIAIETIPELVWLGTTIDQRYINIEQLANIATEAASIALRMGESALALEWLEQGRSIVWSQTLHLRSPLDKLRAKHPSLAESLEDSRSRLQSMGSHLLEPLKDNENWLTLENSAQQHHELATQYTELMGKIRQLPGFENFLRPKSASELTLAATNGPVVVLNIHEDQCDALITRPRRTEISHIQLPNMNRKKALALCTEMEISLQRSGLQERTERRPIQSYSDDRQDFRQMLCTLWDDIVKHVLDGLECAMATDNDILHITWCTTGPLSFLPLHAAGYYDRPHCKIFNYAISSYTPTLSALIASDSNPESHSSIAAIGQEETPGFCRLPGTVAELEYVRQHARGVRYNQLTGNGATPEAALELMERHDWIHLACHAHQDSSNPRNSGFFLSGGSLNLASITEREFKNKGLAFLSACQTATGDKRLADEAVHLASGMLIAGYPSVVATMWAVGDSDAPFVADKMYKRLLVDGKMDFRNTAKALHHAIQELKKEVGEDRFECWVPFIHIGS